MIFKKGVMILIRIDKAIKLIYNRKSIIGSITYENNILWGKTR